MAGVTGGWRKSRYSFHEANCVEVAEIGASIRVRDSKNPGPTLTFPWEEFVIDLKMGAPGYQQSLRRLTG